MASLLQTIDTAHEDMIHDAQMDYYGIRLATCSSDRSVKVFDIRNGTQKMVADLKGHEGPVWQIAWAHPMFGTVLASCSYDRKVILWKETDGVWSKLEEFKNHDSSVNSICWAPHEFGLMLACGSSDGAVSIVSTSGDGSWESQKINNAHTIGCNAVSWAPAQTKTSAETSSEDSKALKRFVTGGCDNLVKIWKFSEAESKWVEEHKLEAHSDWVRDVAWAPSPGLEAQSTIASCSQDRRVILWTSTNLSSWNFQVLSTFDDVIWHVSWSVTGNILAVSGGDNKVTLWKETVDSKWVCISDDAKSQNTPAAAVGSAERNL
uniref:Protein SEC13 homolog n=1 Tax=Amblyomma tuberculatum TaxID=48802 RepID=A0A6M2E5K9_9ACAR